MSTMRDRNNTEPSWLESNVINGVVFVLSFLGLGIVGILSNSLFATGIFAGNLVLTALLVFLNSRDNFDAARTVIPLVGFLNIAVFLVMGFVFWSPKWQPILYALIFIGPVVLQWIFVISVVGIGAYYANAKNREGLSFALAGIAILLVIVAMIGFWAAPKYSHAEKASQLKGEYTNVDTLPETSVQNSRMMPKKVAKNLMDNSLQYPMFQAGGSGDITFLNNTPHWSWHLSPSGLRNTYMLKQQGAVFINQSTMDKDMHVVDSEDTTMRFGVGMGIRDNLEWQLARDDYWKSYQDAFPVPHGDTMYIAVPYIEHNFHFGGAIPQVYTTPEFGGVKLVDNDGNIEDLSPQEARDSEILDGQNFYPYDLARYEIESMAYKHGIVNTLAGLGRHKEQISVPGVPGQGNSQPFTIPTEEGIKYFVSAEPWGTDANAIYQVWVIDARTGELEVKTYNDQSLRGARKASESVMAYGKIGKLREGFEAVEPLPVVRDGTLYWQVRIVPSSSAKVSYIAFFNSHTEDVTVVQTGQDVRAWLSGSDVSDASIDIGQSETSDDSTINGTSSGGDVQITIQKSDGTTETITVEEGSTVTIKP